MEWHLLGRDGIHLTKPGKGISTSRMADLIRRASNGRDDMAGTVTRNPVSDGQG